MKKAEKLLLFPDICVQSKTVLDEEFAKIIENEVQASVGNFEGYVGCKSGDGRGLCVNTEYFSEFALETKLAAVSIANNHVSDNGMTGFSKTIEFLDNSGIKWFGTKSRPTETLQVDAYKIAFLGSCWKLAGRTSNNLNVFGFDLKEQRILVSEASKEVGVLIWFPHWGVDLEIAPHPWQFIAAKAILDSGASAIYGCHPHYPQIIYELNDTVNRKPVVFSGGTAVLPRTNLTQYIPLEAYNSYLLLVDLKENNYDILQTTFDVDSGKLSLVDRKPIELSSIDIEESLNCLEDYSKAFRRSRKKKHLPIYGKSRVINSFKMLWPLAIMKATNTELYRKIRKVRNDNP